MIIGWTIFIVGILQLFIWSFWFASQKTYDGKSKLSKVFGKDNGWGPDNPEMRIEWQLYKSQMSAKYQQQTIGHSKIKIFFWNLMGKYY